MINDLTYKEYLELLQSTHLNKKNNNKTCQLGKALEIFSGKWRVKVAFELSKKEYYRFGELKKAIPEITNTMLTSTLKDLESMNIVHREQFNEIPPRVEYSLTKSGKDLLPIFFEIAKWAEKYR